MRNPLPLVVLSLLAAAPARADPAAGAWHPVPWVTAQTLRNPEVQRGGEGGQWPRSLAIDGGNGDFLLHGTDVGGLFRSLDGGGVWEPANVGYAPRGTCGVAIDPRNPDRCLSVGANSVASETHGVWLSTDRAASWQQVLWAPISATVDFRSQLAYDAASYDPELGYCTDAYWSRIRDDVPKWGEAEQDPSIHRTSDGGRTWERLPGSEPYAGGHLATHPTRRGVVYVTHPGGLSVSEDRGEGFELLLAGEFTGLAVSPDRPDAVWLAREDGLMVSADRGRTWTDSPMTGADPGDRGGVVFEQPTVSPVDADRVAIRSRDDNWQWTLHVSRDGGVSFENAAFANDDAFLPFNVRHWIVAWSPADPDLAHTFGGDWVTRSTDGGGTFRWHADGVNEFMAGGAFHFSHADPSLALVTAQDYNGAVTRDAGRTWRYVNLSGERWGGSVYGGYAVDERTLLAGLADGWGGKKVLRLSRDGGQTVTTVPGVAWTDRSSDQHPYGLDSCFADPERAGVWFAGPHRSADAGETWSLMDGCHGVLAAQGGTLYGAGRERGGEGRSTVVTSTDGGASWRTLVVIDDEVRDVAPEVGGGGVYFVAGSRLCRFSPGGAVEALDTPGDVHWGRRVTSVATDPDRPGRVYAAQTINVHKASVGAMASDDGGRTWASLTRTAPLGGAGLDGGNEASWVRVNPATGDAWFGTSCYGLWRWAPAD